MARGGLFHAEAQFSSIPPYAPSSCSWSLPLSCPRWSLCMWLRGKRTSCWKWYLGTMSQGTWEGRKNRNFGGDRAHVSQQRHSKHGAKMLLNWKWAATSLNATYWNCRPMYFTQDWGREAVLLKGLSSAKTYSQGVQPHVKQKLFLYYYYSLFQEIWVRKLYTFPVLTAMWYQWTSNSCHAPFGSTVSFNCIPAAMQAAHVMACCLATTTTSSFYIRCPELSLPSLASYF